MKKQHCRAHFFLLGGGKASRFLFHLHTFVSTFFLGRHLHQNQKSRACRFQFEKLWNFKWVNHHKTCLWLGRIVQLDFFDSAQLLAWLDELLTKIVACEQKLDWAVLTICKLHSVSHILSLWKTSLVALIPGCSIKYYKIQIADAHMYTLNEIQP